MKYLYLFYAQFYHFQLIQTYTPNYIIPIYNSPTKMQILSRLLRRSGQKCVQHDQQAFWVCYDLKCMGNRFICKNERCNVKHQGHRITAYSEFKESLTAVEKHINAREDLAASLIRYQNSIVNHVQKLMDELKVSLFTKLNKYCSPCFLQMEKLYKKKGDYVPLLFEFEQNFPQREYGMASMAISQKQSSIYKLINKQELALDNLQFVQTVETVRASEKQTEMKIKQVLPFKCDLKLKFRASGNQFLSKNLHALNLRGPIVLFVRSHKGREFGGYSSIMFPKYQQEQNVENRNITAFLFSLDHAQLLHLKDEYKKFAIKGGINFGFGRGDLLISDECHKGNISWAEIGRAYKPPNIKGPLNEWLAGAAYFRVLEYEIYAVQSKREK